MNTNRYLEATHGNIEIKSVLPREVPTRIAVGVARPSAHGQDTTWTNYKIKQRMRMWYVRI